MNYLQFLIGERYCMLPVCKSDESDDFSFGVLNLPDQQRIDSIKINDVYIIPGSVLGSAGIKRFAFAICVGNVLIAHFTDFKTLAQDIVVISNCFL